MKADLKVPLSSSFNISRPSFPNLKLPSWCCALPWLTHSYQYHGMVAPLRSIWWTILLFDNSASLGIIARRLSDGVKCSYCTWAKTYATYCYSQSKQTETNWNGSYSLKPYFLLLHTPSRYSVLMYWNHKCSFIGCQNLII